MCPPGKNPALRGAEGAGQPKPRHAEESPWDKRKDGHEAQPVLFFWVTYKVCPRKQHPNRDGADSKVCRGAHASNSFAPTIFYFPFFLFEVLTNQNEQPYQKNMGQVFQ